MDDYKHALTVPDAAPQQSDAKLKRPYVSPSDAAEEYARANRAQFQQVSLQQAFGDRGAVATPTVTSELSQAFEAVRTIGKVSEELMNRLIPVLSPGIPMTGALDKKDSGAPYSASSLAEQISVLAREAKAIERNLVSILDRVNI